MLYNEIPSARTYSLIVSRLRMTKALTLLNAGFTYTSHVTIEMQVLPVTWQLFIWLAQLILSRIKFT